MNSEKEDPLLIICISPSIHLYRWISAVKETGKIVYLVNLNSSPAAYNYAQICDEYISLGRINAPRLVSKVVRFLILIIRSRKLIKKHSVKLVNLHYCDKVSVLFLAMLQKVSVVLSFWGTDAYIDYKLRNGIIKRIYDYYYAHAVRITCNSEVVKKILASGGREIDLINWPLEMGVLAIPTVNKRLSLRAKYNIPSEALVLLSSRALKENYSIIELIKWFERNRLDNSILFVHIPPFSDATYKKRCLDAGRGVPGVIFSSIDQDIIGMSELYALADVQLNFPINDSIPSSILEAMACGCSVVANRKIATYQELALTYSLLLSNLDTLTIDDLIQFLNTQQSGNHIVSNRNLVEEFYSQNQFIESVKTLY